MRKLFLKPPRCAILLGFFCIWARLNAQAVEPNDWKAYFPMSVGNEWQYKAKFNYGQDRDIYLKQRIVKDTLMNGQTFYQWVQKYYELDGTYFQEDFAWLTYNETLFQIDIKRSDGTINWWGRVPCRLDLNAYSLRSFYQCDGVYFQVGTAWAYLLGDLNGAFEEYHTRFYSIPHNGNQGIIPYIGTWKHDLGGCPLSDPCATTLTLEYAKVLHPRLGWLEYGTGSVLSQAEEVVEHLSVAVYPNPFTERIQLNTNEAIENLVVYDIQGRQLLEANTVQDLVLSSLSAGNYILQVTFQNQRRVQKLITKN